MQRLQRLLLITFIESFATIVVERGIYFYTDDRLGFSPVDNLWLALVFGTAYVAGAVLSHRASARVGEKVLLALMLIGQAAAHAVLAIHPTPAAVFLLSGAIGGLNGMKWPLIESFISAGRTPGQAARTVGHFSVSWALAVPLALLVTGPLIQWLPRGMFVLCAAINVAALVMIRPLGRRPTHLAADHPERPTPEALRRITGLLGASRWTLFAGYASMWVLAALMPEIFDRLGYTVAAATALSGLLDVMRLAAFVVCMRVRGWHWRGWPVAAAVGALPVGFAAVLFGGTLWAVLAGEALFGLAIGLIYYAALWYAMVAHNASVESGGVHEALIGLGFSLGPAAGLLGTALTLTGLTASNLVGATAGVGSMFLLCAAGAARALWRVRG